MNWFKSYYNPCMYSQNWYGTLDYAPKATVIMYDDNKFECVGYMESDLPDGVVSITEAEANEIISKKDYNSENVWYGDKLLHRWDIYGDVMDSG